MRKLARVLLVGLGFMALVACQPPGPVAPPTPPPHAGVFGDSLTNMSADEFAAINVTSVNYQSYPGASLWNFESQVLASPSPTIVLAFGTNDSWQTDPYSAWDRVLVATAGRCVVWVKPYEATAQIAAFNYTLAVKLAIAYPAVKVLDWNKRLNPAWLGPDGVHYNADGQAAYAQALVDAIRLCP